MKLTTITHVTVDGVMQGLGAPDEDRRGGFERGGWQGPLVDEEEHPHRSAMGGDDRPLRDVAAAIGELKAKPGGELQVHGSGILVHWLLANQLVDELILLVFSDGFLQPVFQQATDAWERPRPCATRVNWSCFLSGCPRPPATLLR